MIRIIRIRIGRIGRIRVRIRIRMRIRIRIRIRMLETHHYYSYFAVSWKTFAHMRATEPPSAVLRKLYCGWLGYLLLLLPYRWWSLLVVTVPWLLLPVATPFSSSLLVSTPRGLLGTASPPSCEPFAIASTMLPRHILRGSIGRLRLPLPFWLPPSEPGCHATSRMSR